MKKNLFKRFQLKKTFEAVEEVPADETASEENVEAVEEVPADETASEENVEVVEEISADETVAEENVEAVEEIPAEEILSEENIVEKKFLLNKCLLKKNIVIAEIWKSGIISTRLNRYLINH